MAISAANVLKLVSYKMQGYLYMREYDSYFIFKNLFTSQILACKSSSNNIKIALFQKRKFA